MIHNFANLLGFGKKLTWELIFNFKQKFDLGHITQVASCI
jgi:hypothetical protein